MSRANKNIREIVTTSRASDRTKSTTKLQPAASSGKITTLKSSNISNAATYHTTSDNGIKMPTAVIAQRHPQSLGRTGQAIIESKSVTNSSKLPSSATAAASAYSKSDSIASESAKENSIVIEEQLLDNLSFNDLKRSYIILGKEFKNKTNTVMALQRNFAVVSKLCQSEQAEKEKVIEQSRAFKKELDERVERMCELFE